MLTNLFKVAILPQPLYEMAFKIVKLYEEGELVPPSSSKQRQRRTISSSSFSFLKGLDPLNVNDQKDIQDLLSQWLETKIRPQSTTKVMLKPLYYHLFNIFIITWHDIE